jgi:phosphinothricin acetyltransferase
LLRATQKATLAVDMHARHATPEDAAAIAAIYNQAIADGVSTFETRPRDAKDIERWFDGVHPVVVVEQDGQVVAFAATFAYNDRECYRGVAEFSVYVDRDQRKRGAGKRALLALYEAARQAGFWKLVSRIFPDNAAVRTLNRALGIREVGVHANHARQDGVWRDVIVVEWLIAENIAKP